MSLTIHLRDIDFIAVRAQGPGGQNVNKVSSAVHLRFNIRKSSLPEAVKEKLLQSCDHRVTKEGEIVIKAQSFRSRDLNKAEALQRLHDMVKQASTVVAPRLATKPSLASKRRRLASKALRASIKTERGKVIL